MTDWRAHFLRWRFGVVTFAAAVSIGVTVSLGQWQMNRAAQKNLLTEGVEAQKALSPLDTAKLSQGEATARAMHRPVSLKGHWVTTATVYLDNRQMYGRPGFYVLTPLQLEGQAFSVMVQRGWIARNFMDRTQLAPVETPAGQVTVQGRIAPPPGHLFEFNGADSAANLQGSSPIRQNLDLAGFAASSGLNLATAYSVLETGAASQGLQREWPLVASGVSKHYGYAFQWFGLASLITILYVWFQFITPWRRSQQGLPRAD